jgi:cobalt-zinc-cadmium efflux system membrane fusion protein
MKIIRLLLLCACTSMLACDRGSSKAEPPAAAPTPAKPAAPGASDTNTVRIEAEMLRDLRITTAQVESRPGGEQITLQGELAVDQRAYAEVGVPVAARVTRLLVNAGDTVRQGEPLAALTSAELGMARADYLSAKARVTVADAALERKRGLAAEKIVPLREVQEAESQAAEARAALRSARAAIGAFGVSPPVDDGDNIVASTFVLRAPLNGQVIERTAVVGQMLDPASPAFRIGNLSTVWLTVHAFERDAVRIQKGVAARLAFPALPGQDFRGTVAVVGRQVERESRTVPVRIDVRNEGNLLRPGMSASASLPVGGAAHRSSPCRWRPYNGFETTGASSFLTTTRARSKCGASVVAGISPAKSKCCLDCAPANGSSLTAPFCSKLRPRRAKVTTMSIEAPRD